MAKLKNDLDRRSRRNEDKQRQWRRIVAEQQRGGRNVRDFCRERGLNENSFYHWRRELRLRDRETDGKRVQPAAKNALAPVVVIDEPVDAATQRSQYAATQAPPTAIEIALPDGTTVRVMPGVAREQLENVFSVLESARC